MPVAGSAKQQARMSPLLNKRQWFRLPPLLT